MYPVRRCRTTIPFQYQDGWFFSGGAEYMWNERLTLRGGVGYEKSPITDDVRIPLLPDNDRYWLSIGGTYRLTPKITFDVAYSHLFVKDTPTSSWPAIRRSQVSPTSAVSTRTSTSSRSA